MLLEEIIQPDSVLCNAHARSKKHSLEIISELLVHSHPDIASEDIFESLIERERLGCTSLEQGVAFPHCRVEGLDTSVGALIKLSEAVEFDSADGQAVDLIFGLLVPATLNDQDKANIHNIAELLRNRQLREGLRGAASSSELYETLCA